MKLANRRRAQARKRAGWMNLLVFLGRHVLTEPRIEHRAERQMHRVIGLQPSRDTAGPGIVRGLLS
jgi:hypothetical protein